MEEDTYAIILSLWDPKSFLKWLWEMLLCMEDLSKSCQPAAAVLTLSSLFGFPKPPLREPEFMQKALCADPFHRNWREQKGGLVPLRGQQQPSSKYNQVFDSFRGRHATSMETANE